MPNAKWNGNGDALPDNFTHHVGVVRELFSMGSDHVFHAGLGGSKDGRPRHFVLPIGTTRRLVLCFSPL